MLKEKLESDFKRIHLPPKDQRRSIFIRADETECLPEVIPPAEWRAGEPELRGGESELSSGESTYAIERLGSGWRSVSLQVLVVAMMAFTWWQWFGLGREIFHDSAEESDAVMVTFADVGSTQPELAPLDDVKAREAIDAYLRADSIGGLLPWVRDSISVVPLMEEYYQTHDFSPDILASVDLVALTHRQDRLCYLVRVEREREGTDHFVLFQTSEGMKIDWQSYVGFNASTWSEIMQTKPTERTVLRTHATPVNYFNDHYDSDSQYLCVELHEPEGEGILFGYAAISSALATTLSRELPWGKVTQVIVEVVYEGASPSANQVRITELIQPSWVMP